MTTGPTISSVSREIRVFISSTFRDMQGERELLVKQVFPELRRVCAGRFVTFTEIDLRWGITREQAAEGQVLPICLEEIYLSRPFFIGLLGERYGWIPHSVPPALLAREPWLREHAGLRTSVTELEILHGVLNNPEMAGHAFFYFRDPRYLETLSAEERREMVERDLPEDIRALGEAEAARRTQERKARLAALKGRIRESGLPLLDGYPDPEALAAAVREQFLALIDRLYPESAVSDPIDGEALAHEGYARRKLLAFVPRPAHREALDDFAGAAVPALVVCGESGGGKTVLLADWVRHRHERHSEAFVFAHYFGATPDSASAPRFLYRLLHELQRRFGLPGELPSQTDELREAPALWLAQIPVQNPVILVLDGLDQIEGEEPDRRLAWLPRHLPSHVRVLASALPGPALDALRERDWAEHPLPLPDAAERAQIIDTFFRHYRKEPGPALRARLAGAPGSANPLFLRTVLEELRQFGSFEQLDDQVAEYLTAATPGELFRLVLRRWKADFDAGRELVRRALGYLWAARQGLSETEWRELLGSPEEPLLRRSWSPLFLAMEPHLVLHAGLYTFGHEFLRSAVEAEFLADEPERRAAHRALADYFDRQALYLAVPGEGETPAPPRPNPRKLAELAHQFSGAGEDGRLFGLFDTQEWLHARFEGDRSRHHGFLADLQLAWLEHAYPQVPHEPRALPTCFRLALVRTSINSVVENVEASLVAPAVSTGLWSFERGLGFLQTMENADQRSRACLALFRIGALSPQQCRGVFRLLLTTTPQLERGPNFRNEISAHDVLCQLAPLLEDELLKEAWSHAVQEWPGHNGYYKERLLAAYAPRLSGENLSRALDLALRITERVGGGSSSRTRALRHLAPYLGDRIAHALDRVLELDERDRAEALVVLGPYLTGPPRERARAAALALPDDTDSFEFDWYWTIPGKQSVLGALADPSPGPETNEAARRSWLASFLSVRKALERTDPGERLEALLELIPGLAGHWQRTAVEHALEALKASRGGLGRSSALIRLSPYLPSGSFPTALSLAMGIDYSLFGKEALDALFARADRGLDPGTVTRCFDLARNHNSEWERARLLAGLAPRFDGDLLEAAVAECDRLSGRSRVQLVEALAPLVRGELRRRLLATALATRRGLLTDPDYRIPAAAAVAPFLDRALLGDYFQQTRQVADEEQQLAALTGLLPGAAGAVRTRALDRCLALAGRLDSIGPTAARLAPHLNEAELPRFLDLLDTLPAPEGQVRLLTALGDNPRLTGPPLVARAFQAALRLPEKEERSGLREATYPREQALVGLAPRLGGREFPEALASVSDLDARRRASSWGRSGPGATGQFLARVLPHLEPEHLEQFCEAAAAVPETETRASLLLAAASHLSGPLFERTAAACLEAARAIWDKPRRVTALAAAAAYLEEPLRADIRLEALEAAVEDSIGMPARVREVLLPLDPESREALARRLLEKQWADGYLRDIHRWREVVRALAAGLEVGKAQPLFGWALDRLQSIRDAGGTHYRNDRWNAMVALLPHLHPAGRRRAAGSLLALCPSLSEHDRANLLKEAAPWVESEQAGQALRLALELESEQLRTWALNALSPRLDVAGLEEVVASTRSMQDEGQRASVLQAVAPYLPASLNRSAREPALAMRDRRKQWGTLWVLLAHLEEPEAGQALREASTTDASLGSLPGITEGDSSWFVQFGEALDERDRTSLLREMLPSIKASYLPGAFELVRKQRSLEGAPLEGLAPRLGADLLPQALEMALSLPVWDSEHQISAGPGVKTLQALAPRLEGNLLAQALERAIRLPDRNSSGNYSPRAAVLHSLAPQFGKPGGGEAYVQGLAAALSLLPEPTRSQALNELLQAVPDENERVQLCCRAAARFLAGCANEKREHVLGLCVTPRLFGPSALLSAYATSLSEQILDVCTTWQWP